LNGEENRKLKDHLEASVIGHLINVQLGPHPQCWIQVTFSENIE
jgi:aromatic ring-cleaving dioxygenase